MTEADKVFAGRIPALYQQYMVPMLFQPYTEDMADRIAPMKPRRVLETASGTGVLTRAMAGRLGDTADIVATDLNQPMLDLAASLHGEGERTQFLQADALALPFPDASFDVVVCQFGVMFFPDKLQAFREAKRVLTSGGRYLFSVWDRLSANAFVTVIGEALAERFQGDAPQFMERTPHGYYDVDAIAKTLSEADFSEIEVESVTKVSHADSAMSAAIGYCQGSPLRGEIEGREPDRLAEVTEFVGSALADRFGRGPIKGNITAHIVAARS